MTNARQYKYGNYSLEELADTKEDVKKELTYSEATANRNLSWATLHAQ